MQNDFITDPRRAGHTARTRNQHSLIYCCFYYGPDLTEQVCWSLNCIWLLWPHGLLLARLVGPWDSPGKNTGVHSHSLLQGIFPTQGLNLGLLHCRQILYHLSYQGSPKEQVRSERNIMVALKTELIFLVGWRWRDSLENVLETGRKVTGGEKPE